MDAIASTAFGVTTDSQNNSNDEFIRMGKKAVDISLYNPVFICMSMSILISLYLIYIGSPVVGE